MKLTRKLFSGSEYPLHAAILDLNKIVKSGDALSFVSKIHAETHHFFAYLLRKNLFQLPSQKSTPPPPSTKLRRRRYLLRATCVGMSAFLVAVSQTYHHEDLNI